MCIRDRDYNEEVSFNTALLEIEDILKVHNLSCQELGLPVPTNSQRTDEANAIDPIEQEFLFCEHYETANIEQRNLCLLYTSFYGVLGNRIWDL